MARDTVPPRSVPRPVLPEPAPDAVPVMQEGDEDLHEYLRFELADDIDARVYLLGRARVHGYAPLRYVRWDSLRNIGIFTRLTALTQPHWHRLFSIDEAVCTELTIEFLSTFHLISPLIDYDREDALTFRLRGVERRLSLRQFAIHMGLYTEQETATPAFTEGITTWPEGHSAATFWAEIGEDPYDTGRPPKSKKLLDPLHRVIHRAIAHSLSARTDSAAGNVTLTDLFYMFCIIRGRPCQIALCLAHHLLSLCRPRITQGIYGGGFVTHLATRMGILTPQDRDALTLTSPATPIDFDVLVRMEVIVHRDGRYRLIDGHGRLWVPPGQGGAGPSGTAGSSGAGPSGTAGTGGDGTGPSGGGGDMETDREAHEPVHVEPPVRDEPVQTQQPVDTEPRSYAFTRDYRARLSRVETSVAALQQGQSRIEEMLRLEFAHSEAYRLYTTAMLRRLLADTISDPHDEPVPPAPPQRLSDYYSQAGPSDPDQQPPQ